MTMSHGEWNGLLIILTITWTVRRYDCCEAVNSMRWATHYKATQVSSWILMSCQPRSVTSGLIMHYIKIPSHQLRTQVTRSQVTRSQADSCTTALDAPQSTASAIKRKKVNNRWKQQQIKNVTKRRRRKKTCRAQIPAHAAAACSMCLWKAHTHTHTKRVGWGGGAHAGPSTNNTEFHILSSMISNSRSKCRKKQASS